MEPTVYQRQLGIFDLTEEAVWQRLPELPAGVTAELSSQAEGLCLRLQGEPPAAVDAVVGQAAEALGVYCYSCEGESLASRDVALLRQLNKTVALAESCTGGMVAARLTDVPGCSQVFGTGVVSYSCACKEHLLHVRRETLRAYGAVSEQTACEMARGVRRCGGADIGISITGEAGPQAAEDKPVGTVFVALADHRRVWVRRLQLGGAGRDRAAIRQLAAAHALDLLRRYLEAYPAVMAGGIAALPEQPEASRRRKPFLPSLLPRRGEARRVRFLKLSAWVGAVLLLAAGAGLAFSLQLAPDNNRQLQDDLRRMYWDEAVDRNSAANSTAPAEEQSMISRFRSLYALNADIGGWIRIADTVIDYPVMRWSHGYYENHNFSNQLSHYGQPFFDEADTLVDDERRTMTIYGKNTRDGQMFSELLSYRRIAFLKEHPVIEMNTLYRLSRWEVFAVLVMDDTDVWQLQRSFADGEAYERYLEELCSRSLYTSSHAVTAQYRLLALSTDASREYGHANARFVVVARRLPATAGDTADEAEKPTYTINPEGRFPDSWFAQEKQKEEPLVAADYAATTTIVTTTVPLENGAAAVTTTVPPTTAETTTAPTTALPTTTQPEPPSSADAKQWKMELETP